MVYANAAPGREDEFNYWYHYIHIPDVLGLGIFDRVYRYEATRPGPAQYLTLWESDYAGLQDNLAELDRAMERWRPQGRIWPVSGSVWAKPFFAAGPVHPPNHRPVTFIITYQINCGNPGRDEEFNQWHNDLHAPEFMATGYCHTAYKYQRYDSPQKSEGKFLAVYESDVPSALQEERAKELRDKYSPVWYERVGENRLKIRQQGDRPRPRDMVVEVAAERSGTWRPIWPLPGP